jgi:hypothetical protein
MSIILASYMQAVVEARTESMQAGNIIHTAFTRTIFI